MATSPKFLYFDLGGVLLSFSHEQMCVQMAEVAGISTADVQAVLFDGAPGPSLQWRLERGEVTVDEAYEHFCSRTGTRPNRTELYHAGSNMFATIDDTVALVERLHAAGHALGILSNTNAFDWQFVTDGRFAFLGERFGTYALSFEARAMKPEPEIFQYAAELVELPPEQVFFTDDKQENVDGALAAGFDAVVFESAAQLSDELRRRGIEVV